MATTRFIDHLLEGDHASRPAAGDVPEGTLYSCTTHSLVYQSDTATWTTWATLGGSSDLDAIIAASSGQNIADALAGAASPTAGNVFATMADVTGSGGPDPIADVFGAPSTAFEFNTSSLAGLTAMGTPDAEDADTTVPDHYYVADNASGAAWCGRYLAIPSYSFTAICKVNANIRLNYNAAALFLSVATPGKLATLEYCQTGRDVRLEIFTNPTTFSAGVANSSIGGFQPPIYLGVVATSTSNTTWYWSNDGYTWHRLQNAYDPSMTIGSVGIAAKSENATGIAAAFDYLRIWNSAKTFLTGI